MCPTLTGRSTPYSFTCFPIHTYGSSPVYRYLHTRLVSPIVDHTRALPACNSLDHSTTIACSIIIIYLYLEVPDVILLSLQRGSAIGAFPMPIPLHAARGTARLPLRAPQLTHVIHDTSWDRIVMDIAACANPDSVNKSSCTHLPSLPSSSCSCTSHT